MDIDWKNVESVFIKDDLYEHFNAPKYVDFSTLEQSVNDVAWFCRPDCRHPSNADDFKVKHLRSASSSEIMPLGEGNFRDANLKRRGNVVPSENSRTRKPSKNFHEDGENENPNISSLPPPTHPIAKSKTFKSTIKSSAEKKKEMETNSWNSAADCPPQTEDRPQLKSTHSARNLFAGREILNQISEFCNELKKLALNASEREDSTKSNETKISKGIKEKEPLLESKKMVSGGVKEKKNYSSKIFSPEAWRKKNHSRRTDETENSQGPAASPNLNGNHKGEKSCLQVRSCPPSPQRFPSPLKPPKSRTARRGMLQEVVEQSSNRTNEAVHVEDENILDSSADVFWFLKPCTYLGK